MAKLGGKKKQNGYKMAEEFPKGELLLDNKKNTWRLGTAIGSGGFGLIYTAQSSDNKSNSYPYAVKIEPIENGPLFVEVNFYIRNGKEEKVEQFRSEKNLSALGMSVFIASGSHILNGNKYRFLVLQKFGANIWKLFLENKCHMAHSTVYKLGIQVLYVLEYIHSTGYIHGDIKGANLLLGENSKNKNQVYLVDFGLASKFNVDKVFKVDPKKAHDGTIEYTSRDAHDGVPTRRGDIEILFYNLLHWSGAILPWEKLKVPKKVHESKIDNMNSLEKFLKTIFNSSIPDGLLELGKYLLTLKHHDQPNYNKMHEILLKALKSSGGTAAGPLVFKTKKRASTSDTTPSKKLKASEIVQNGTDTSPTPVPRLGVSTRRSCSVDNIPVQQKSKRIAPEVKSSPEQTNNIEVLTSEMIRIKEKLDAKKAKRPRKVNANANELVPVPSTSTAKPSAGLKKKHIADALPLPMTRLVLENKDPESDEDAIAYKVTKRKSRK